MFRSERPNTSPVMPGPLTPCWRLNRRPSQIDLAMWRIFDSTMRGLLGRTPCDRAYGARGG